MKRWAILLSTLGALASARAEAAPTRPPKRPSGSSVDVTVVEVAGGSVYVKPGASAGVRRGSTIVIDGRDFTVTQSTSSYAVADASDSPPREGDRGRATVIDEPTETPGPSLRKPRAASAFEGVWPAPQPPATLQRPRFVPLGDAEVDRRYDVTFMLLAGLLTPLGERGTSLLRGELGARVRAEPFSVPLAFLLDASVQKWIGIGADLRDGNTARPLFRARELMLRYGTPGGVSAGLGRMRYAAATLGTLDGLRLRSNVGDGFAVAAFGGALPDPLSSDPSTAAQRFGVEATYSAPDRALRPELALVAHGSTFGGKLDERRVSGVFGVFPGKGRFGGHFEIGSFPADNPFGAAPIQLNNGGLDASVRLGILSIGGRVDLRRPERSLWLASYLPLSFFCLTAPAPPTAQDPQPGPEVCDGRGSLRAEGAVDATITLDDVIVAAGANAVRDVGISALPSMAGGFASARVLRIARSARADGMVGYSRSTYLDMLSVMVGPGVSLARDEVDLSTYYRYTRVAYATSDVHTQHGIGSTASYMPSAAFAFALQGEGITGGDAKALLMLFTATWRPLL